MKEYSLFIMLAITCILLVACQSIKQGKTDNVILEYGNSTKFSTTEIQAAMSVVLDKFKEFEGCELLKLTYNEESSNAEIRSNIESHKEGASGPLDNIKEKNAIILVSEFHVDSSGGDGSLTPNETYSDFKWELAKNEITGTWEVKGYGYA